MRKKHFDLVAIEANVNIDEASQYQAFLQNYRTALFLVLLNKNLLTQWQFDRCQGELQAQQKN